MLLKISDIILTLFLLVITTGFTISKHFCHDRLVNTEVFYVAQSCHEMPESCCDGKGVVHCSNEINKNDCCKNENELVKFTEQFTFKQKENPAKYHFTIHFASNFYRTAFFSFAPSINKFSLDEPPLLSLNLQAFIQSFHI